MSSTQAMSAAADARSLGGVLQRAASRWPDRAAHQDRDGVVTYEGLVEAVRRRAAALRALGLAKGDRLALVGESSRHWATIDWAALSLGIVVVPIYPTLPAEQALYIARDAGCTVAACSTPEQAAKFAGSDVRGVLFAEIDAEPMPEEEWTSAVDAVAADELATIIYTSGTTGDPKGAMHSHRAFIAVCAGIPSIVRLGPGDVFLSFLPLSHVFERFAGHVLPISLGATIAYSRGVASLQRDFEEYKPTIMLVVPRFLEAFASRIREGVRKQPRLRRALFALALSQARRRAEGRWAPLASLLDRVVLSKVRARAGGRMRYFVSGGAALPPAIAELFIAIGIPVLQGYGLTETMGANFVNRPEANKPETVGQVLPGVEAKLAEDGEILLKGECRMLGYYGHAEETAKVIDDEGWFHTGDIGEFDGPYLKITDRKKDIIVLGNGKNVAPQPIENLLKESPTIAEAVVLGDGKEHCSALIVPDFDHLSAHAKEQGWGDLPPEQLASDERVRALLKEHIETTNARLADYQKVIGFAILDHGFSQEEGELTPTLKVKRRVVQQKYAETIATMRR